jgi:hypothetical protein
MDGVDSTSSTRSLSRIVTASKGRSRGARSAMDDDLVQLCLRNEVVYALRAVV